MVLPKKGTRAKEHFLLKYERPNCVTMLLLGKCNIHHSFLSSFSLVCDTCSSGKGTGLDVSISMYITCMVI